MSLSSGEIQYSLNSIEWLPFIPVSIASCSWALPLSLLLKRCSSRTFLCIFFFLYGCSYHPSTCKYLVLCLWWTLSLTWWCLALHNPTSMHRSEKTNKTQPGGRKHSKTKLGSLFIQSVQLQFRKPNASTRKTKWHHCMSLKLKMFCGFSGVWFWILHDFPAGKWDS